jgi:fluoroquinolone transport system permease protein
MSGAHRRLAAAVRQDLRFQFRYGFYFLYAFMSALYCAILALLPAAWRVTAASFVVLTDPAMLGFFFIGGLWLLEKGEGVHAVLAATPLSSGGYLAAKALSLGSVAALAGTAVAAAAVGLVPGLAAVAAACLVGSASFTLVGLYVATFARTVNHYLILSLPAELAVALPPILILLGVDHPLLDPWPGSLLLAALRQALGTAGPSAWPWLGLAAWAAVLAWPVARRLDRCLGTARGEPEAAADGDRGAGAPAPEARRA